jgi:hypothetical protein
LLRNKSNVIGGWLPSLTSALGGTTRIVKTIASSLTVAAICGLTAMGFSSPTAYRAIAPWLLGIITVMIFGGSMIGEFLTNGSSSSSLAGLFWLLSWFVFGFCRV